MVTWAGRSIRFLALKQQQYPDKLTVEAQLEISGSRQGPVTLFPAQVLHLHQNQWTSEVAIDSSLIRDFYVILDSGRGEDQIHVTFSGQSASVLDMAGRMPDWPGCAGRIVAFPLRKRNLPSIASCTQIGNS